ncbi:hypothetical protein H8S95_10075 [Pontibacter sp. KCTC 32443]|uniref:DUF2231 domain-containing protein n=1 Tax=Pontibacter TaxID=323449 RepID=UPI00164D8505|nr:MULTISPECIES: DUF2231 domain-containing protein [Pontibacter]MBC5774408.1 hypothetical protein [Pontibacter sp. KCTC 32443]
MNEPTFWRTEIWHPLSVHFPIAILLLATIAISIAGVTRGDQKFFWQKAGSYLLYLGALSAWVAIYTGDMADATVSRKICDPTVLKDHEIAAFNVAYLFSAAAMLNILINVNILKLWPKLLRLLVVVLMVIGAGYLTYAGHLGAQVVYNQAGGVNMPASDCAGF